MVAGALANKGGHPPPTTSRPLLPPRCGCTPDTAFAARDRPPPLRAGFQPLSLSLSPFHDAVRKRVARLPAKPPSPWPVGSPALSSPFLVVLRCRPPLRPTPPRPPAPVNDVFSHRCEPTRKTAAAAAAPARSPRRFSYAATAITFAGKSSGAVGTPGLTLQGAVRGATASLSSSSATSAASSVFLSSSVSRRESDSFRARSIR